MLFHKIAYEKLFSGRSPFLARPISKTQEKCEEIEKISRLPTTLLLQLGSPPTITVLFIIFAQEFGTYSNTIFHFYSPRRYFIFNIRLTSSIVGFHKNLADEARRETQVNGSYSPDSGKTVMIRFCTLSGFRAECRSENAVAEAKAAKSIIIEH